MISGIKPFDIALQHRAALAETAYKKLKLVWNSFLPRKTKLRIFQSVFIPTLIYGLDSATLTDKYLKRTDAYYIRFLRKLVSIKASFCSHVPNNTVWRAAGYPPQPAARLNKQQAKRLTNLFLADPNET